MIGEIERLVTELARAGVRYVVVGGVGVVLHGYLRATEDLDVVIDSEPANLNRLHEVLRRRGFAPVATAVDSIHVFAQADRPLHLNVVLKPPISFDQAYQRA